MRSLAAAVSQVMREYDEAFGPGAALRGVLDGLCALGIVGLALLGVAAMFDGMGG